MQWGIANNYSYHISIDIDEYMYPIDSSSPTLADAIDVWFKQFLHVGVMYVFKYGFNPSPHILEPIDLLTIEAFQTRYTANGEVNYYMSVQPKVIYKLAGDGYNNDTIAFLQQCCGFHGCEYRKQNPTCLSLISEQGPRFNFDKRSKRFAKMSPDVMIRINHYARSFEKYTLKAKTW
jgi:hypothetical protein